MSKTRISERTKKKLRQQAKNLCPTCGEDDEFTFQYHHIKPLAQGGKSEEQNLILLCANCHSKVTHGKIEESEILRVKELLSSGNHPHTLLKTASNVVSFTGGTNSGHIANKIEIKTQNKTVKVSPPVGAIASSLMHRNYTKYLIDRYHEFKKSETGSGNMRYSVLYRSMQREFGAKWDMIPLGRFGELSAYLQSRIDNTILGKNQKAKGRKNSSTFEEYRDKYHG